MKNKRNGEQQDKAAHTKQSLKVHNTVFNR